MRNKNTNEIQQEIYETIEVVVKKILTTLPFLSIIEGKIVEVDPNGDYYKYVYQEVVSTAFSINTEEFEVGDMVYIISSNAIEMKKLILTKSNSYTNAINLNQQPKVYSSIEDPSPSFGKDGDIWIKYKPKVYLEIQVEKNNINDNIDKLLFIINNEEFLTNKNGYIKASLTPGTYSIKCADLNYGPTNVQVSETGKNVILLTTVS